jgi:hypothetical protein
MKGNKNELELLLLLLLVLMVMDGWVGSLGCWLCTLQVILVVCFLKKFGKS